MRKIEGWIKIDRKLLDWGWYTDINTFKLFLHMLLKANWRDGEFLGTEIKKGSFASSISKLSSETGLTEGEIRTAIGHLKSTGELTSKGHSRFTVFTIKNYSLYQMNNEQSTNNQRAINKQSTSNQQTINEQSTTIEERKKYKKAKREEGKNIPPISPRAYFPDNEKLDRAFADFYDFRRRMKAPLSDTDCEKVKRKLLELSMKDGILDTDKAVEILNQSIINGWKGLFPLDRDKKKPQEKSVGEQLDDLREQYRREGLT